MRELIVFNREGNRIGRHILPEMHYLTTEKEYVEKTLMTSGKLDGIAIVVDWNTKEITCTRNLA